LASAWIKFDNFNLKNEIDQLMKNFKKKEFFLYKNYFNQLKQIKTMQTTQVKTEHQRVSQKILMLYFTDSVPV